MKKALFIAMVFTSIVGVMRTGSSQAVVGSDFPFGRIIDDVIFRDTSTMTIPQIQTFLESKVQGGSCDRNRPTYNPSYNPPWTCLFEFEQNPTTNQNNYGQFNSDGSPASVPGGLSAAEIIWQAGQDYDINPQVLIVLLQKEQGLVTDNWPWTSQYSKAAGFNCPDTAPCNPATADFSKQVRGAAWSFNYYIENLESYWYGIGSNDILYNPNSACGRKTINIENAATVALYLYTPYTPNQAALDNLYGTGDSCSAYGNRNFWRYFNDWFGSTHANAWNYSFSSSSYSQVLMQKNETKTSTISITNQGSSTWYAEGSNPTGQPSLSLEVIDPLFNYADTSDSNWIDSKTIRMTPAQVEPGEVATFTFRTVGKNNNVGKPFSANFVPKRSTGQYLGNINMRMIFTNLAPKWSFVGFTGLKSTLLPNEQIQASITIKNISTTAWYSDGTFPTGQRPTRLALKSYKPTEYADNTDSNWLGTKNQIKMSPSVVNPGDNATFNFTLEAPIEALSERLHFVPVLDGVSFLKDINLFLVINTPEPILDYQYVTATNPPSIMAAGSTVDASLTLKNTGNVVWRNPNSQQGQLTTRLGMRRPGYRASSFFDASDPNWLAASQIKLATNTVSPGENGVFNFKWKAPTVTGEYREYFAPVIDGYSWLPDKSMLFVVNIP